MTTNTLNKKGRPLVSLVVIMVFAASVRADTASQLNEKQALFAKFDSQPISNETKKQAEELIQKAVLAEDWEGIVNMLSGVSDANLPVEYRMIKGHACLATNRNNESLCLFLSVKSKDELLKWQKWSENFATRYPNSPITHYFTGDALARLGKWEEALTILSKGLEHYPKHALLLNARGIIFAQQQDWYKAIADFEGAIECNPMLADAYANRGTVNLHKKNGAKGAVEWFNKALSHSQHFSLAVYNRGFAMVAIGQADEGPNEIQKGARELTCFSSFVDADMEKIILWLNKKGEAEGKDLAKADVGSQLDRIIGEVSGGNINSLNRAARLLGKNPELAPGFNRSLEQISRQKPELANPISAKINGGFDWTRPEVGGARGWLNTLQGLNLNFGGTVSSTKGPAKLREQKEITGGIGFTPTALIQQHQIKTDLDNKGWEMLKGAKVGANPVGGVSSSLASAFVDEGDWPFEANYGLLYDVYKSETPSSKGALP